jgi:CubicO group peptidase (beta-lactamase class C family)
MSERGPVRPARVPPGACVFAAASLLVFSAAVLAQPLPPAAPEDVGLSRARLERLDTAARGFVERGEIAGAVVLLARRGRVAHFEAYGQMDRESGRAMRKDAIFRICSMSKPITSVAAMVLFDEGRFLLDDPVSKWLPEFKDTPVTVPAAKGAAKPRELVRLARPITIRDLLTHTSGISYRFIGDPAVADLYAKAGITDGLAETELDLAENVRRIAAQPLLHQPGERWSYGLNTDVLGRVVEVVSGSTLREFLNARILSPLGMRDTDFFLPEEKVERLASVYRTDRGGRLEKLPEGPLVEEHTVFSSTYPYRGPRRYQSGGAGLVSTAADYARFAHMLLNGGELDGQRVLSRKTVELMTAEHVAVVEEGSVFGFGLGLSVARDPGKTGAIQSEGSWGWGGFYTTQFWIDPREKLVGVILTQTYPFNSGRVMDRLQALAYQAIVD